jgi:hypothetical protein
MAALRVIPALKCREEFEIAFYDHANGFFGIAAQFDDRTWLGPDDFEHRAIHGVSRGKRQGQESKSESWAKHESLLWGENLVDI